MTIQKIDYSTLSVEELKSLKEKYEVKSAQLDARQLALKIALNSAYGALGCGYFRFYKVTEATGITVSGQATIKYVSKKLNEYLNKILETKNVDYAIYNDTDSGYFDFTPIVEKFCKGKTETETVDFLQKVADIKIQDVIAKIYEEFAEKTNAFENHLDMKREAIGSTIFLKKKKYAMRVFDSEGVRFATPTIKITGHEAVRTQSPEFCRKEMKKVFEMIFTTSEKEVVDYIQDVKSRFMQLHISDIGSPTGVKNLAEYDLGDRFKSGAPHHVKAAIQYNRLIQKHKLQSKYRTIMEGEKVKLICLMKQNPIMSPEIAFPSSLPVEFGLDKYIDKEAQFQKYFLDPMKRVLDVVGWKSDNRVTLDDFFG